jgi:prepilin-type N-terminal cleavage/methylation domain-containing protein
MRATAPNAGFTLTEVLVTMILMGVIALFALPKLVLPKEDRHGDAMIRDSFTLIGEAYLARKRDSELPAEQIGTLERELFGRYLYSHLNYTEALNPNDVDDYCEEADYFKLPMGVVVRQICDIPQNMSDPARLEVTLHVPTWNNTETETVTVVIPKDTNRYMTPHGSNATINPCTHTDEVMKVVDECPG